MSHLVMLHGIVLSLATGGRVVLSLWSPPEFWLLYLVACLGLTFATKRLTWKPESPQNPPTDPVPPNPDPAKE